VKGLGKILLEYVIDRAKELGFHKLVLSTFEKKSCWEKTHCKNFLIKLANNRIIC